MATPAMISVHNPQNDTVTSIRLCVEGAYHMHTAYALPKFHNTQQKADKLAAADLLYFIAARGFAHQVRCSDEMKKYISPSLADFHAKHQQWDKFKPQERTLVMAHVPSYLFTDGKWHKYLRGRWVELKLKKADKNIKYEDMTFLYKAGNQFKNGMMFKMQALNKNKDSDCPLFASLFFG